MSAATLPSPQATGDPGQAATPKFFAPLLSFLPEGRALPEADWRLRHTVILWTIGFHAVGLAVFGLLRGWPVVYAVGEGAMIALLGAIAYVPMLGRRFRSSVAALALVTSSAVLVQFSANYGSPAGGFIEMHFHYFVVVAIVAIYQDWAPFLLAVLYVAVDHGVIGTLFPDWVYNHPDAIAHPWKWAAIHAVFVLAECVALVAVWRASEQARARSDLVLRSTGEGLLGVDLDSKVTFANPAALTMIGKPESVVVGSKVGTLFTHWPLLTLQPGRPDLPGKGASAEAALCQPTGTLPVEVVATPLLHNGVVEGSVIAFKDITERKLAEKEHAERIVQASEVKRLQEEADFKTLFINTAAHELRTPLTPLKLQLHVLRGEKRGGLNEEQRRITNILGRNLDRLGQLVEDVLDVGRLQAGRIRLEKEPMDLERNVADVVEAFQELAHKNGVTLELHCQGGLPLEGDPRRLTQILFNLVDNALKFTPANGRIDVHVRKQAGQATVDVVDTGIGLGPEELGKLFHPFSQVHDPMEKTRSGSGLGLYISRGLAELHGGTLECKSAGVGTGTTFSLTVPTIAASPETNGADEAPAAAQSAPAPIA